MKILVSNLGSTSFKYKLFDMPGGEVLARGGMDRIGGEGSVHTYQIGDGEEVAKECSLPDHASAIDEGLARLVGAEGVLASLEELDAVGFKTVHARDISGVVELDGDVVERMVDYYPLAPAHNPAYVAAIEQFAKVAPDEPLGIVVSVDAQVRVIEYSDLPADAAGRAGHNGDLATQVVDHLRFRFAFHQAQLPSFAPYPFLPLDQRGREDLGT